MPNPSTLMSDDEASGCTDINDRSAPDECNCSYCRAKDDIATVRTLRILFADEIYNFAHKSGYGSEDLGTIRDLLSKWKNL